MHIDARTLEDNSTINGDICIVGAGAAGISFALQWKDSPYRIVLLEGGGFSVENEIQDSYRGKTTGQRYFPLQSSRLHYFGGTTGHWAGFCSDYDAIDFRKRSWVPESGWPIPRSDLDNAYARAHSLLELGPYQNDVSYWLEKDPERVSLPFDSDKVYNKVWQFSPPTRFGTRYKDEILRSRNITLYTYANATEIRTDEIIGTVTSVTIKNLAGRQHAVKARYFVLACCSIQNARLLLCSNRQFSKGLGNAYDKVGRYFMEHIEMTSGDLYLREAAVLKLYMWEFFSVKMRVELALTEKAQEELGILNGTVSLSPHTGKDFPAFIDTFSDRPEKMVNEWQEREKRYSEGKQESDARAYRRFSMFTRMEQAPNPSSRVTLDNERDAFGMQRVILHWELTPLEKRSIRKLNQMIGIQAGVSGIGRVKLSEWLGDPDDTWPSTTGGGWHHMGTTRMHQDPKQGVVNSDCRVHGIRNLFIAGGSCFSTAGAANPTLTVVALTLRLSDHLKQQISN
jgi:choline dehydrogenase-like flavoprotein